MSAEKYKTTAYSKLQHVFGIGNVSFNEMKLSFLFQHISKSNKRKYSEHRAMVLDYLLFSQNIFLNVIVFAYINFTVHEK